MQSIDLSAATEGRYQRLERANLPDSAHLSITRDQIKEYIVANIDELMRFADINLATQELGESVNGSIHCRVVARHIFLNGRRKMARETPLVTN